MSRGSYIAALVAGALLALAAPAVAGAAKPVPSLQPQATAKLWHRLVQRRHVQARTADCQRLVFYAPTDWLRLATKLAANQAACAHYYISIPPLAADKTTFRPDQPWRIRALGPNFHALAEISYKGWGSWVSANASTWYAAGVEARKRMAAQGFDVAAGDTWIVNESSSAVRTGTGVARQNLRDLVRGLYDAGGAGPAVKGGVFVVGVGQSALSLSTYKGTLQLWYADSAFWTDMSVYVSDWSQEVYGDVRNYAVAGADVTTRRDELNAWLQHPAALVNAGPPEIAAAKTFLQNTYSPLANAAWRYPAGSGFGWADVPYDQMQDYVAAQTYALASAGSHFGFAWAPSRPDGVTITQFSTESSAVLDQLAGAIHDPASACAVSCTNAVDGASFNEGWKDFVTWSTPTLTFGSEPATLTAGTATGPLTVRLQLAGITRPDTVPVTVTLSSDSAQGGFSTSATGPWTATLDVPVAVGATDAVFYYRDTSAGVATISATAPGRAGAQQAETVQPGAPVTLRVTPSTAKLAVGGTQAFSASGTDAFGNVFAPVVTWSASNGTVSPTTGTTTTFTARKAGSAKITAKEGALTAHATVKVSAVALSVSRVTFASRGARLLVTVAVVDSRRRRIANAAVRLALRRDGHWLASATARTNSHGLATVTRKARRGCYSVKVARVTTRGLGWNRVTPKNGFCVI
ncbi:MAG: Ig domain-containing protein [Gaiellaceae bacterium]